MTVPIGSVNLVVNTPGIFQGAPQMGAQGLIISNESPFNVRVSLQGTTRGGTLLPETVDFFPIDRGFNGNVEYTPTSVVTNPSSYTAATLSFEVVGMNEILSQSFPLALTRPAVTATASGKPIFSAVVNFGSTASGSQQLNIFNPANSGLDYVFHSARVFTNDTGTPSAQLVHTSGADNNYAGAVSAVSHVGQSNPPTSTAHCTFQDVGFNVLGMAGADFPESIKLPASVVEDLLLFPDTYTLTPGNNLLLSVSETAGKIVYMTLKWTEAVATPAPSLAGVPILTAANIVNDSSPAGTGIVEATVSGDTTSAVFITNDGTATFGDTAHPGKIKIAGAANPGLDFTGMSGTNPAMLLGSNPVKSKSGTNVIFDTNAATDSILLKNNGTTQAEINSTGLQLDAGTLTLLAGSLSRVVSVGNTTIANAGTSVAHTLGAVPDFVLCIRDLGSASADVIAINFGTMTSTHFTAYSSNAGGSVNCRFLLFKF